MKDYRFADPYTQHSLATFNYYMGMRMTFNKAEMIDDPNFYDDAIKEYRATNYEGRTNKKIKETKTEPFGAINQIPYTSSGGYAGKGGYVAFFQDNWNITEAATYYYTLLLDGLFDKQLVSITLEIMAYNQNLQTGVNIAFEFMINNAGEIQKNIYKMAFFTSRYNKQYKQLTPKMKNFIIFIDVLYLLGSIIFAYNILKRLYKRGHDVVLLRIYAISINECIDFSILVFSSITWFYFIIVVVTHKTIKLPVESLEHWEDYDKLAYQTSMMVTFGSINTILLLFRSLVILTVQFPAFGALFDTLYSAGMNIMNFMLAVCILLFGFVLFFCL